MRDALYEESAQSQKSKSEARMYTVFHVFGIIFAVIAVIHAFFCILVLPGEVVRYLHPAEGTPRLTGAGLAITLVMWLGLLLVFGLISFVSFRMRRRFNKSYDYIFVEDELRITVVFNGKKRKHLCTLRADQILKIGNCEDEGFERTVAGMGGQKPQYMTPNSEPAEEKYFIYILYSGDGMKNLYVIECRMEMLEYLVRAAGRTKLEWKR